MANFRVISVLVTEIQRFSIVALLFLSIFLLSPLSLQARQAETQHIDEGARKMMTSSDTNFAIQAAQGGLAEVKLGKLAASQAQNSDVKAFGQQMVDDHTHANNQLKAVAQTENMTLPSDMNSHQQTMFDRLSKLSGSEFDREYVNSMVKGHEQDVKDFGREAKGGKDPQMKSFAAETLPIVQGHLQKIKLIQSQISGK